jgi:hypothetical protein
LQNQAIQFDQHLTWQKIDRIWPPINLVPVRPDASVGTLLRKALPASARSSGETGWTTLRGVAILAMSLVRFMSIDCNSSEPHK